MDCSMPGFPVLYHLPEFAQTHVCWVHDASLPSHPLLPSPPAPSLSQHQALRIRWPKYWCFSFSLSPSNGGNVTGALINMWKRGVISFEISSCWKIEDLYTFRAWAKLVANKMAQRGRGLSSGSQLWALSSPGTLSNGWRHFGSLKLRGRCYWQLVSRGQGSC